MSAPTAAATGTLGSRPLVELLTYSLEKGLSGAFVLELPGAGKGAITLQRGTPKKSKIPVTEHQLGTLCVHMGFIQQPELDSALAAQLSGSKDRALLGHYLLENGSLTRDQLDAATQEQTLCHLEWLSRADPETVYGYYDGQDFLQFRPASGTGVDPLEAIWRCMQATTPRRAPELIDKLGRRTLRLHERSRIGRFRFSPRDRGVLDVLRAKPQSYPDLLQLELVPEADLQKIIYTLAVTRHLDVGARTYPLGVESQAPTPPPAPNATFRRKVNPTPPGSNRPGPAGLEEPQEPAPAYAVSEAEVEAMAAKLEGANYYELLNVVPEADTASIQSAFFQLAKTWHPDRAAAAPELRSTINQIFAKLSEAHQVLSNGAKRSEYDRLRSEGGDSEEDQAQVQRVLRAATQFQKAEVLARKADWAGAEALAQKAAEADPDQPEYIALHAYLQAKSGSARGDEALAALIAALSKAHKAQPLNIRIRYYRAQVLKLAGRSTEAMRDFRAVVDQEPGNVDAQRELRLYKMRGGEAVDRAAKKSDGPGLLGRLFKK